MDDNQRSLNEEGRRLWNEKAAFWDNLHGEEGNRFHRELIGPAVERLLAIQPGERVLDIACGSGQMARRLAALGGQVTAVDFSEALLERARARGQSSGEPIRYQQVDATEETALVALGEGEYDAVICTMALMDIPVIAPLYRAIARLLQKEGRFVFATTHPAFNSNPTFFMQVEDRDGQMEQRHGVQVSHYLQVPPLRGMGARGEPAPHLYYHRPLQELLGEAFAAGLVLDGLEEPAFPAEAAQPARPLSWYSLSQIPPILAGRFRKRG